MTRDRRGEPARRLATLASATCVAAGALVTLTTLAPPAGATETGDPCPTADDPFIDQNSPALVNLGFPQSWRLATGAGVTVAVVDSGVDVDNLHLGPDVVLPGTSFVSGPGVSPDGRNDIYGHGTAVAGIIAARNIEGSGLVGAAYDAKILPVQVFSQDQEDESGTPGEPSTPLMAAGIRWAADNGADVINVSMSTDSQDPDLASLQDALTYAHGKDVVVVASAGNYQPTEDGDSRTESRWPAADEKTIGVAATNATGVVDAYTVHGEGSDVAAPGENVLVSSLANRGDCIAGVGQSYSSWAAPFVAGLAAQLRERYPRASAEEIAYRILASADRPRLGYSDSEQGWGQIRPYEALSMTIDPTIPGPPLPKGLKRERPEAVEDVEALGAPVDPWADARQAALWWGLGGVGLTAFALIVRPATRRRTAAPAG